MTTVSLHVNLLGAKFHRPAPPRHAIARPALIARLDGGLAAGRPLTLISAPAGYGKTTVAAAWAARLVQPVAWLALDEADDDPLRFCTYFVAALQRAVPGIGDELLPAFQAGQMPAPDVLATLLLNDLERAVRPTGVAEAGRLGPLVCILDDFHVIQDAAILGLLQRLLAHPAAGLHLVLVTREDPALPLARLRARDQVTEIRADDLRFAQAEVAAFLRDSMGITLAEADLARLAERTEGWPAGLQLAGLSMQGHADPAAFIAALSGSHRFILSYLTEEVLAHQPPAVREFLLRTSILDHLCSDLCDAVLAIGHQADHASQVTSDQFPDSQAILTYLERANVFLIPLDDEGRWYRYHHLFAELLRGQLRSRSPELLADLHHRASLWYEAHLMPGEAIAHALAVGEHGRVVDLLERHGWALLNSGHARRLEGWLRELPPDLARSSPRLSLDMGWMYMLRGGLDRVGPFLAQAETALPSRSAGDATALQAECLALRANLLQAGGKAQEAVAAAEGSLALTSPTDHRLVGLASLALGGACRQLADFDRGVSALQSAIEASRASGELVTEMLAVAHLTLMAVQFGRLRLAAEAATDALAHLERSGTVTPPIVGAVHGALGLVYYEWNDLERSREHLERGIRLGIISGHSASEIYSRVNMARLLQSEADLAGAAQQLDAAATLLSQGAPGWVRPEWIACQASLALTQSDAAAAEAVLRTSGIAPDDPVTHRTDVIHLAWLRLLATQGDRRAPELAQRIITSAEAGGRNGTLLQALILAAGLHAGQPPLAHMYLDRAVALAEPEGAVRLFLEEAQTIGPLIQQRAYPSWLAQHFPAPRPSVQPPAGERTAPSSGGRQERAHAALVEPLSERELEVLRLLAQGFTYAQIADQLVVSLNTVRFHVKSIYGKLGVNRQTHAVSRGRELGLL